MPEVAFVEFPPKKSGFRISKGHWTLGEMLTVLVEEKDGSTSKVDGVCSAQSGNCVRIRQSRAYGVAKCCSYSRPPPTTMTLGAMICYVM